MPGEFDGGRPRWSGKEPLVLALLAAGTGLASFRAPDAGPSGAGGQVTREPAVVRGFEITLEPVRFGGEAAGIAGPQAGAAAFSVALGAAETSWQGPLIEPAEQGAPAASPPPSAADAAALPVAAAMAAPPPEASPEDGASQPAEDTAAEPGDAFADAFAHLRGAQPAAPADTPAAIDPMAAAAVAVIPPAPDAPAAIPDAVRVAEAEPELPAPPVFSEPPQALTRLAGSEPVQIAAVPVDVNPVDPPEAVREPAEAPQAPAMAETAPPAASPLPEALPPALAAAEPVPEPPAPPQEAARPAPQPDSAATDGNLAASAVQWAAMLRDAGGWTLASQDANAGTRPMPDAAARKTATRKPVLAAGKYRVTGRGIEFALPVVIHGGTATPVPLLIDTEQNVSMRLVDLLALVEPMLPEAEFGRLAMAQSAQEYVSLRQLRSRGMDFRYDAARNRLVLEET